MNMIHRTSCVCFDFCYEARPISIYHRSDFNGRTSYSLSSSPCQRQLGRKVCCSWTWPGSSSPSCRCTVNGFEAAAFGFWFTPVLLIPFAAPLPVGFPMHDGWCIRRCEMARDVVAISSTLMIGCWAERFTGNKCGCIWVVSCLPLRFLFIITR